MKKLFTSLGWHFGGAEVKIDSKLTFQDIGNLLLNLSNGTALIYLKTAVTNAWRLRDNDKGTDIMTVNTSTAYLVTYMLVLLLISYIMPFNCR